MLKNITVVYKLFSANKLLGVLAAIGSLMTAVLLTGVSGWFITITGLTGAGLLSRLTYNQFLPSALIRFLAVGRPLIRYYERLFTHRLTLADLRRSRAWVFRNVLHLQKQELTRFRTPDLAARIVADIDEMDHLYLGMVIPFLSVSIAFLIAAIVIPLFVPGLLWVIILVYFVSGILIPWLAFRDGRVDEGSYMEIQHRLKNDTLEFVEGRLELKLFGLLEMYVQDLLNKAATLGRVQKLAQNKTARWAFLSNIAAQAAFCLAVWIGLQTRQAISDRAAVVLILLALLTLFESPQPLPELWHKFAKTMVSCERLSGLVNAPGKETETLPFPYPHKIHFNKVCLSYGERIIFNQLDLTIQPGAITLLTGPNGSGKSTLLDMIAGLKRPEKGDLQIGNHSVGNIASAGLTANIGLMEQQVTLFNRSIYENIAMGKAGASADEIINAALRSGVIRDREHDVDFLYTSAGKCGERVSGGQARMISLARIILKDAPVMLLDEPTEGLDEQSENRFVDLLRYWRGLKTIVIVSHNESLLSIADHHVILIRSSLAYS